MNETEKIEESMSKVKCRHAMCKRYYPVHLCGKSKGRKEALEEVEKHLEKVYKKTPIKYSYNDMLVFVRKLKEVNRL